MRALFETYEGLDVRAALPAISAPTLILHRRDDVISPLPLARPFVELIPGAKLIELPGADHFLAVGDTDSVLDEIEEFLTGEQRARGPERMLANGFLATFDGPARGIRAACAIRAAVRRLGVEIRSGLHAGECEVIGDDVGGIAVHIGARVGGRAGPGEVLVSGTVKDLVIGSASPSRTAASTRSRAYRAGGGSTRCETASSEARPRPKFCFAPPPRGYVAAGG